MKILNALHSYLFITQSNLSEEEHEQVSNMRSAVQDLNWKSGRIICF